MKKTAKIMLCLALALALCLTLLPGAQAETAANATSGKCGENLSWTLDKNGNLTISGSGPMEDYSWEKPAPWGEDIKTVTLKNGMTSIGDSAFVRCRSLKSVTIPSSVTKIGNSAFSNSGLTSVEIPKGVTSIGESAFMYCSELPSVTIPASVTSMGSDAFRGCDILANVTISEGVTMLGTRAFYGAPLKSVTIPSSMKDFAYAFQCARLTSVTIGKGVAEISDGAFAECEELKSVTIPSGLTKIGESAFGRTGLESITIPSSVTKIGDYAFEGCYALKSVTIPSGVTKIGTSTFLECMALQSVTIEKGVKTIGDSAFSYCSALKSVTIPSSVTKIGEAAFGGCSSLTSVTIPSSVTKIGDSVFHHCSSLAKIKVNAKNTAYEIRNKALVEKETDKLLSCPGALTGTYKIPASVKSIGKWAFSGCESLTGITLPAGMTRITLGAFSDCKALKSFTIPSGVTKIGDRAFGGCTGLQSMTIPAGVKTIGDHAFNACSSLKTLKLPKSLKTIGSDAFYYCGALDTVCYAGTKTQWGKISISLGNEDLTKANIYYNYVIPAAPTAVGSHSEKGKPVVSWEAVKGAEKYQVWRSSTGEEGSFKRVSTTTKLEFTNGKAVTGETYYYKVRGVTVLGETGEFSKVVKLTAKEAKPIITAQPKDVSVPAGETAVFTVKATGKDLSYQWQYRTSPSGKWSDATAEGNQTATLQVPAAAKKDGWQYRCVITNAGGKALSEAAVLSVTEPLPVITAQPKDAAAAVGETAVFTVKATGKGLTYQWQYRTSPSGKWSDATAEGNQTATLQVPAAAKKDGWQYRCVITNAGGKVLTEPVTLTVK